MCHTPIVIRATRALFQRFDDEIYPWIRGRHVRLMPIGASARPMSTATFSGFYESHEPPPSGDVRSLVRAHCHGHENGQPKWSHFASPFCFLSPWRPPGRYGASSCPMTAFSGFYESPGPCWSGDECGIAPSHRHGHWNGLQGRYFCSLSPPFLPGIIIAKAKDHVMVHLN